MNFYQNKDQKKTSFMKTRICTSHTFQGATSHPATKTPQVQPSQAREAGKQQQTMVLPSLHTMQLESQQFQNSQFPKHDSRLASVINVRTKFICGVFWSIDYYQLPNRKLQEVEHSIPISTASNPYAYRVQKPQIELIPSRTLELCLSKGMDMSYSFSPALICQNKYILNI